jgi:hypothetical protein
MGALLAGSGKPGRVVDANETHSLIEALGKIGGEEAHAALEKAFHVSEYQDEIIRALITAGEQSGVDAVNRLTNGHAEYWSSIVRGVTQYCGRWGLVDQLDGSHKPRQPGDVVTPLRDRSLLEKVIGQANGVLAAGPVSSFDSGLDAVAAFDLPEARAWLVEVASRPPMAEGDLKRGDAVVYVDPRTYARDLLGQRGIVPYVEEVMEAYLDRLFAMEGLSSREIELAATFPKTLLRQSLRHRMERGQRPAYALWILSFFAEAEDLEFFEQIEKSGDIEVADIAHEYLAHPGQYSDAA